MTRPARGEAWRGRRVLERGSHQSIRHWPAIILTLAWLAALPALTGCESAAGNQGGMDSRFDRSLSAEQNLSRLSEAEIRRSEPSIRDVPPPPGVEVQALEARDANDLKAWVSLNDALDVLDWKTSEDLHAAPVVKPDDQQEALRRYVRGREAAQNERYLEAITELRQAHTLDPGSPEILRELARSYLRLPDPNTVAATTYFADLLRIEPDDSEAALHVAMAAANRRDFEAAAATVGRVVLAGGSFEHDPAGPMLADYTLWVSFQQLGYDRAAIEAGTRVVNSVGVQPLDTLHAARIGWLSRQRGELWRGIGDAHCRLGEINQALSAYQTAGSLPLADRDALIARMVFVQLRLGRPFTAQRVVLAALQSASPEVSERLIGLCGYLARYAAPVDALAEAVRSLHERNSEDESLVRAAASLLPTDDAIAMLRRYVQQHPEHAAAQSQLLRWLARHDDAAALQFAIAVAENSPEHLNELADQLAASASSTHAVLEAMRDVPDSAIAHAIEARLRLNREDYGRAWSLADLAVTQSPNEPAFHSLAIDIAAGMHEPGLLKAALQRAGHLSHVSIHLAASRAYAALGEHDLAIESAVRALAIEPDHPDALMAEAAATAAIAGSINDTVRQRELAAEAIALAERAISLSSANEAAYSLLLSIYDKDGLVTDEALYRQTRRSLAAADRDGRLNRALQARDDLVFRRYEQALEQALALHEAHPSYAIALDIAIEAWRGQERLDAAMLWIEDRLENRPGDPILLDRWLTLHSQQETIDLAISRLRQLVAAEPEHLLASRLLELACRVTGRTDEATALGEMRLLQRPEGIRRELELSDVYVRGNRIDDAITRLQWVRSHADEALRDQLLAALASAHRLPGDEAARDGLILDLAHACLARFPDMPLQVYGVAMESMSRLGQIDENFDELVSTAVTSAPRAGEADPASAGLWIMVAQSLIDAEAPLAAARALRGRIDAPQPLERPAFGALARAMLAANAAARRPQDTLEFLKRLDEQGQLSHFWFSVDDPPTIVDSLIYVSSLHVEVGDAAAADLLISEAVRLAPGNAMAKNDLGYTRIERGIHDDQTIKCIEDAFEVNPRNPNVQDTMGWLRYKQGRFEDDEDGDGAVTLISRAVQRNTAMSPEMAEVIDHLGDALWRAGQHEQAIHQWHAVASILDNREFRRLQIAELQAIQSQVWSLLVFDPAQRYDRVFGSVLERAKQKSTAASRGEQPRVAPTFAELEADQ